MESIGYSCPIRLVLTYILPIEIRLFERFHRDSFETEGLVRIGTGRLTWLDRLDSYSHRKSLKWTTSAVPFSDSLCEKDSA